MIYPYVIIDVAGGRFAVRPDPTRQGYWLGIPVKSSSRGYIARMANRKERPISQNSCRIISTRPFSPPDYSQQPERKLTMRNLKMAIVGGLLSLASAAHAGERDFTLHNDTPYVIENILISTRAEPKFNGITNPVLPAFSYKKITVYDNGGSCQVQMRVRWRGDEGRLSTWGDGFDLCTASDVYITYNAARNTFSARAD